MHENSYILKLLLSIICITITFSYFLTISISSTI
nr:MAG TPA: hypothetical protein [Bacteriophage sp.]DAS95229.1 MAG TPA: hypothetical protein [Bacteriophage sp.]